MSRALLHTLLTLCLSSWGLAQEKATRTCRILFLGAPPDAARTIFLHDGTQAREVELPRMNLSDVYPLPTGPLTLRLLQKAPIDGAPIATGAPQVTVDEATKELYLLISADPENKVTPLRMQVINANSDSFAKGQMMWYNLSSNRVGGQVGSQKLAMDPKSRVILDAPAKGNADYNVNLSYYIPGREALYPLCETKWHHDPKARGIYFIVNHPGSRTPRVMGFPDYPNEEKQP